MLDPAECEGAGLVDALRVAHRAEAVAAARRWAIIAAVVAHHCDDEDEATAHAVIDGWEYATAEVSAVCGLSKQAAAGQMRIALALRDRLPKIGALLAAGVITAKIAAAITWRTRLVFDAQALALIDAALAEVAPTLGVLSQQNIEDAIDVWVEAFDPAAVPCARSAARSRYLEFGTAEDLTGTVGVYGRMLATDAATLRARLSAIADTVCAADPRTRAQRLVDALGLLGADPAADRLACQCEQPDCPAAGIDPRAAAVTVYVLTDTPPTATTGDHAPTDPPPGPEPEPPLGVPPTPTTTPPPPREPRLDRDQTRPHNPAATTGPGILLGGGVLPAPMLADLITAGAGVVTLNDVTVLEAERGYRPSAKLTAWVRARDLTCTFPGCTRAAPRCDLDHVIPWPAGATHPGNLSAKCRTHHLLKTFGGWTDHQHADGTHTWTSPTGHAYTTVPLSRILFPDKPIHTPAPPPRPVVTTADRQSAMPGRRRTRDQTRAARVTAARRRNQHAIDTNTKPPPF
ncbi:DUF222 domain-containing protein [Mycolicibacterium sp. 120266]|uniref:HNH endonuclease signature motif containing protein n=1 Tax=Mycolicibacterium sp. 120266 TaxID=3090601 RepID=UPI00299DCE51|nr:DUF222 domain-containing protein [Mycolicibacterium sp. 120266]MDX1871813.1 DUF222 domain-containing protein [Mycolicibacterium sp. 120266]